ncbi:FAD-dependent monooxygenase [Kibdelosporangium philippinense]|uniref:FAD-dependent monooxygenase n=1 Tax=Kibdelosporangium philippinense TaxID=211113 RepID=A0ABS8Z6F0_9PSEU|nr:FAD-dependent monooxygenase [Kibdelosporangium philippinense]MCE7002638.1 FAD-dependent monooxygenase [Kibdelosporangium philippinense]
MRIVICGAGIAGLTLANQLAANHDVTIVEKAPGPRPHGYMIDFFGPGYDVAEKMDLLPALRKTGYQVSEAAYVDENGRRRAGLPFDVFAKAVDGKLVSIMRPDLETVLRERLSVDLRFGTTVSHINNASDNVTVTLSDGTAIVADPLVGADGIHSTVRTLTFGNDDYLRYLGFHTAAYVFDNPAVHVQVGDRFCLTDTVGKQFGFYALRDGRVAAFAVHRTEDPTLPKDPSAAVRSVYADLGWVVPQALEACPDAKNVYYDQVAQTVMPEWSRGRVVLIGDACHAVSLLAGQGASLGMAGAFILAVQLDKTPLPEALTSYEKLWRPVVEEKQQVARNGARRFLPASENHLRIRRAAMRLARVPGFSRYLAGTIAGKTTAVINQL